MWVHGTLATRPDTYQNHEHYLAWMRKAAGVLIRNAVVSYLYQVNYAEGVMEDFFVSNMRAGIG